MDRVGSSSSASSVGALRARFKAQEKLERSSIDRMRQRWDQQLAAASTPQERARVQARIQVEKQAHQAEQQRQARVRAALITSAPGWVHPAERGDRPARTPEHREARAAGQVLVEAYRMVGQKARSLAARNGEEVTERHVELVKLTKEDMEVLAAKCGMTGPGATQRAWALLDKHIRPEMMDMEAERFFSTGFLDLQGYMIHELGELQEEHQQRAAKHKVMLDEKRERIENFVRDNKLREREIVRVEWSGVTHDVRRDPSKRIDQVELAVVGGRLVAVTKNSERK